MNLEFYKINFEEKENDQRIISVGIVRMFPGRIHADWLIPYQSYHEEPLEAGIRGRVWIGPIFSKYC